MNMKAQRQLQLHIARRWADDMSDQQIVQAMRFAAVSAHDDAWLQEVLYQFRMALLERAEP